MYIHINQKGIYFQGKAKDLVSFLKELGEKHLTVKDAISTIN
ncbi:Z-ring formation inhibitor MciZ [Alkalicella caledoniensis]|nr:hypothetical protein [Alkalicella caledoniensis]